MLALRPRRMGCVTLTRSREVSQVGERSSPRPRQAPLLDPQVARKLGIVAPSAPNEGLALPDRSMRLRALVLTFSESRSLWDCGKKNTHTEASNGVRPET